MKSRSNRQLKQDGISLTGFIFGIGILALVAVVALKVAPTYVEYSAIKKAISDAKRAGTSVPEIRASFDRQGAAGYIESVSGKDLEITREASGFEISVEYQKKVGLVGPVSLLIDYAASTDGAMVKKALAKN